MKAKICSHPADLRENRRLAYCGTCKTIGARYGQSSASISRHSVFAREEGALPKAMAGASQQMSGVISWIEAQAV